jgi:hypothetical protein
VNQLNTMVRSVFADLVQKRLWPVALACLVALVAIPLLLSKPPGAEPSAAPVVPATPATGSGGPLSAFQPVVNTEGEKSSQIRKSLKGFKTKDPFKVQGLGSSGGSSESGSVQVQDAATAGASGSATGGGGGPDTGSGDTSFTPPSSDTSGGDSGTGSTSTPEPTYFQFTVDVRFGKGENLDKKRLEQFRALPSSENPVVVFMGARTDGETAVFLVSSASSTTGEGNCEPDDTCTFLYMKAGETQSFEAIDGADQVVTYTLKMLRVNIEEADAPDSAGSTDASSRASRTASRSEQRETFTRRIGAIGF